MYHLTYKTQEDISCLSLIRPNHERIYHDSMLNKSFVTKLLFSCWSGLSAHIDFDWIWRGNKIGLLHWLLGTCEGYRTIIEERFWKWTNYELEKYISKQLTNIIKKCSRENKNRVAMTHQFFYYERISKNTFRKDSGKAEPLKVSKRTARLNITD